MSNAEIEIAVEIKAETPLAYRVYNGMVTEWIPKSQITDTCVNRVSGAIESIFIPEWLAEEKGLI